MNFDQLFNELNDKQKEAVTFYGNPLLVLAPAGSGKTKVITYKILYLIEKIKVSPSKIVALTFTNKAANEMKSRIIDILPEKGKKITTSTFHSFAVKLLRKYCGILGYKENFSIYDYDDSLSVINKIKKELSSDIDSKIILYTISAIKNSINSIEEYEYLIEQNEYKPLIKNYVEYLKSHNAMDFDDLLLNFYKILSSNIEELKYVAGKIRNNIDYLLVDEYQDTNKLQYQIVKCLLKDQNKKNNITIVGDDDQGIYSFRGSTIENILKFENDFADCKIICLEKNYRSSQIILNAAMNVIKNNKYRKIKKMISDNPIKEKIVLFEAEDPNQEAFFVYEKIHQLLYKDGIKHKDIAILYRNNHLARPFEELFIVRNLRHKVWGGFNFYSREEIRDISAYLFTILNPYDEVSLLRIINTPKRGIGVKLVEKLVNTSKNYNCHIFDILKILSNEKELKNTTLDQVFNNIEINNLKDFYDLIQKYKEQILANKINFAQIFNNLIDEIDYKGYIKSHYDEKTSENKINYIESFLSSLYNYKNIDEDEQNPFIIAERIRLLMNNDISEEDDNAINLMTIHCAKGLEFKVVFIVSAEKDIIPSSKIIDEKELEEERRLFYVAMTRAKDYLIISYCKERSKYGKKYSCYPSEFINEIPEEYITFDNKKIDATISVRDIASIREIFANKLKNK